jgi:hypothetical protein
VPYDPTDPRAQLTTAIAAAGVPRPAQYRQLHDSPPDDELPGGSLTWWTRSQAVVVGFTEAEAGEELGLAAADALGEYIVLALDGLVVDIAHGTCSVSVNEPALMVVPAGQSTISVRSAGTLIRLFAAALTPTLAARCVNAAEYANPDVNVAPFVAWPDAPDGPQIRVYPLAAHPLEAGKLGRIFRCSTLMVNVLPEDDQPRDPTKLSPHHHDEFEQISLQVRGDYVHHMRVPWTPDSSTWRADEHQTCIAPAVVVIPPPLIHTSQGVGNMPHWLIDVFAPPRFDFSERPGWVRNADDYPIPQGS